MERTNFVMKTSLQLTRTKYFPGQYDFQVAKAQKSLAGGIYIMKVCTYCQYLFYAGVTSFVSVDLLLIYNSI